MRPENSTKEDRMFLAGVRDRYRRAAEGYMPVRTNFLELARRSEVTALWQELGRGQTELRLVFTGGYEEAERTVAWFLPEYLEEPPQELAVIRAAVKEGGSALTHRDYLGALMGLGIKREMIGDLLVSEGGADIIVLEEIADFLLLNFHQAGRRTVSLQLLDLSELRTPELRTTVLRDTVASLRLDTVIAAAFRISRGRAAEAVRGGLVFIGGRQILKVDAPVKEGDTLVLRGKGKARLTEAGGRTRKDRIPIEIQRYL